MKQVNVLMDELLLEHLEKLSQLTSLLANKKVTVSDIVRKSVIDYTKYGQVTIESNLSEDQKIQINVKPTSDWDELPNDELMRKLCRENW